MSAEVVLHPMTRIFGTLTWQTLKKWLQDFGAAKKSPQLFPRYGCFRNQLAAPREAQHLATASRHIIANQMTMSWTDTPPVSGSDRMQPAAWFIFTQMLDELSMITIVDFDGFCRPRFCKKWVLVLAQDVERKTAASKTNGSNMRSGQEKQAMNKIEQTLLYYKARKRLQYKLWCWFSETCMSVWPNSLCVSLSSASTSLCHDWRRQTDASALNILSIEHIERCNSVWMCLIIYQIWISKGWQVSKCCIASTARQPNFAIGSFGTPVRFEIRP